MQQEDKILICCPPSPPTVPIGSQGRKRKRDDTQDEEYTTIVLVNPMKEQDPDVEVLYLPTSPGYPFVSDDGEVHFAGGLVVSNDM